MQRLVIWSSVREDAIQSFQQCGSTGIVTLADDFPSLEPWHISTWLQRIVTVPARYWYRHYRVRVVATFPNVGAHFLHDFLVSLLALGCLSGTHFAISKVFKSSAVSCYMLST